MSKNEFIEIIFFRVTEKYSDFFIDMFQSIFNAKKLNIFFVKKIFFSEIRVF